MEELLTTAVTSLGGEGSYVELSKLRENADVKMYFLRTLFKPPWSDETFTIYFQSRPEKWEFDEKTRGVKLRSELAKQIGAAQQKQRKTAILPEALYTAVLRAGTPRDTVQVIATAKDNELAALPIDTFEALLEALEKPPPLPAETDPNYAVLVSMQAATAAMHVNAQIKCMAAIPGSLEKKGDGLEHLMKYFKLLTEFANTQADPRVGLQKLTTLKELCEAAAGHIRDKGCANVPLKVIYLLCQAAPFHILALAVASLADKGDKEEQRKDIKTCAACLGKIPVQVLEGINQDTLMRLAIACTKSTGIAEECLPMVAKAAGATLPAWSMDDVAKLLFAMAKAKAGTDSAEVNSLYGRAAEAIAGKLTSLTDTQLIKIILALGKVASVKEFLEAAAAEAAGRLEKISVPQRLLLTQGLLPLGGSNASLTKVLDAWAAGSEEEAGGKLTGDQLAKLAQQLAPVAPSHAEFWKVIGGRLVAQKDSLTDAGKASVNAAFPDGGGPDFADKDKLMATVKPKPPKEDKEKSRDDKKKRSRSREERKRSRSRERRNGDDKRDSRRDEKRDDRKRGRSRSRSRDRRRR
eukprot:TRINITY_DN31507_c0_g1_i1.p1 TRINITY_DN31507_c0_g1~~TRINITY_DN31507_c0_g1_i1.p1  ORF type:complete len:580 (-),score=185.13 TRINITY_DN31507_c0_g1_i1:379-2118(-)